jgi:poly(A) polymerase
MAATGVLAHVLPHAGDLSRFEGLFEVEILEGSGPDALLRLGALVPETPAEVAREAERLRLSGAQRDRLIAAAGREPRLASWASPREQRRVMHLLGAAVTLDRLRLAWSRAPHSPAARDWREQIALAQAWTPRTLGLSGADVVAAGARPGPLVGEALRELEAWWMDEDFPDDAAALRERLAAILRGLET